MSGAPAPGPRRTAPLGILVTALSDIRKAVIPALLGGWSLRSEFAGIGIFTLVAVLAVSFGVIGSALRWWRTTYTVGAEDIRVESGLLSRAARSVPYERIQDVSLQQPLLARALGLTEVRFETGAGGADEIALTWLPAAEGEALRELVRERRDEDVMAAQAEDTSSATPPAETAGSVLFAMGPRRLATFGLFEFSLAAFVVAAGAAQQFDNFLPFDVWDWKGWQARLAAPGHWLAGLGPWAQAAALAIALGVLVVVGFVTGLARTFAREWGFVLEKTAKGFRRRRGLFTRSDVVMPAHRVQALQLRTGLLRRRFGWHALKFVSLAQDAGQASHVVAPFAQIDEIEPIVRAAGFSLPAAETAWHRPAPRAFAYRAAAGAVIAGIIAVGLFVFAPVPLAALAPLLTIPLIAAGQYFRWHRARHALDPRHVYARHGWLAPRTDIADRVRLQSVEIRQGPLARRGGYATLHLGLAGGTMAFEAVPIGKARAIRAAVLESIAGVDYSRLNSV